VKRWRAELALVFNTFIWGTTFVVVKEALADVTPILFLALRFSLATLALVILFRGCWSHPRGVRDAVKGGLIAGAFLFAGYALQTIGLRLTTAPKSAFLTGLATVMVPFLSMAVYKRRPRPAEGAGVLLATIGMGFMTLEGTNLAHINAGDLLTVGCAVAFAAHIVTLGHYSERVVSFEVLSVTQIATAAGLALSLFWCVETPVIHWRFPVIWAILITGLLATALAFTIQAWAQRFTTSTRTALIFTLEPLFAWLTSYLIAGETLTGRATVGAGLILGGVLLVELKPASTQPHPSN
jgi:drug/metabolite transporter (DMT)-like permease